MTKIVRVGIMSVSPSHLFQNEQAHNLRQLMEVGTFGPLLEVEEGSPLLGWLTLACGCRLDAKALPASDIATCDLVRAVAASANKHTPIWDWIAETDGDSLLIVPACAEESSGANLAYVISQEAGSLARGSFDLAVESDAQPLGFGSNLGAAEPGRTDQDAAYEALRARFAGLRACLEAVSWGYVEVIDDTLNSLSKNLSPGESLDAVMDRYMVRLDHEIGKVLEALDDDTVFALVALSHGSAAGAAPDEPAGAYVLAGPGCPVGRGPEAMHIMDLAPTLLAATGREIPPAMQGAPRFDRTSEPESDDSDLDARELDLLRERLSGLGYIG